MTADIVSLKDIEELYGQNFMVSPDLNESRVINQGKSLLDDDIIVEVISKVGPYSTVKLQGGYNKFIIPTDKIVRRVVVGGVDRYKEVLDRLMPGRWYQQADKLYLYYPEITLTNSLGMKHTIYDLVISSYVFNRGELQGLEGKRYSFSTSELLSGYCHSHLCRFSLDGDEETDGSNFTDFCTGGGSNFANLIGSMDKTNTLKEFEMFLIQLEQYLSWESLEGKPYIGILDIGSAKSNGYGIELESAPLIKASKFMLKLLCDTPEPECLARVTEYYLIDISLNPQWFYENIEKKFIASYPDIEELDLKGWDERKCAYQNVINGECDLPYLPSNEEKMVQYFGVNRRVIEEQQENKIELTKRLSRNDMTAIIQQINEWMKQGISKLNTVNE